MRRIARAVVLAIARLSACTIESAFVDMIKENSAKNVDDDPSSISYRNIVSVQRGTYTQYTPMSNTAESFSHTVSDFQIGTYEVTCELRHTVYQWALSNGYTFGNPGREGNDGTLTFLEGTAPTAAKYKVLLGIPGRH